jgi:nucleoid DNA-binding protein
MALNKQTGGGHVFLKKAGDPIRVRKVLERKTFCVPHHVQDGVELALAWRLCGKPCCRRKTEDCEERTSFGGKLAVREVYIVLDHAQSLPRPPGRSKGITENLHHGAHYIKELVLFSEMTRRDLVEAISPQRRGSDAWNWDPEQLSRSEARDVIDVVLDEIVQALKRGENVTLPIGSFEVKERSRPPQRGWYLKRVRVLYKRLKFIGFEPDQSIAGPPRSSKESSPQ